MQELTLKELKSLLKSGEPLDFDIRRNQDWLDDKKFWELPFSITQWKEMASLISPYRFIEALLRYGKNAPEEVYGVTYELFPEECTRLMPLYVSRKHTALLNWVKSISCPIDLSETIQRIVELEELLEKDLMHVIEELNQWKVDQVMFAICACADANVHSSKLWKNDWASAYVFRFALTEIWNKWIEQNSILEDIQFEYREDGIPVWDMSVHGTFSFRFRHKTDHLDGLTELAQRLLDLLQHRFPMYGELKGLRVIGMNEVEFAHESPKGLFDLIFRSKVLSLIDRRKISDVNDQYQISQWIKQCGELAPLSVRAMLEFEGFSPNDIPSLPWKGVYRAASVLHTISQSTLKDVDPGIVFNRVYDDLQEQGSHWVRQLGVEERMVLARFKREDLIMLIAQHSDIDEEEVRELINDMEGSEVGKAGPLYPKLARFTVDSDYLYWPSGLFEFHTWRGFLLSVAIQTKRVKPNLLGQFRENFAQNCLKRAGFKCGRGLKCKLKSGKCVELDVLAQWGNTSVIIEVKGFMNNPDLVQTTKKISSALMDEALSSIQSVIEELSFRGAQLDCCIQEGDKMTLTSDIRVYYFILTNLDGQFTEIAPGIILCSVMIFDLLTDPELLRIAIAQADLDSKMAHIKRSLILVLDALENDLEKWAFLVGTYGQLWHEE